MTRTDLVQSLGTGLALIISVLALIVSIQETNLLKEQQKATVWPYITVGPSYNNFGFEVQIGNKGVGPALIHSAEISMDGIYFKDWETVLDSISPGHKIGYDVLGTSVLSKAVIKAGDEFHLFRIPWQSDNYRSSQEPYDIAQRINTGGRIRICFCSVMDECWVYDTDTRTATPGKVTFENAFEN